MVKRRMMRRYGQYIEKLDTHDIVGVFSLNDACKLKGMIKDINRTTTNKLIIAPIKPYTWALTYRGKKPRKLSDTQESIYFDF